MELAVWNCFLNIIKIAVCIRVLFLVFWFIIRRNVSWPVVRKWCSQNNRVAWFPQTDILGFPQDSCVRWPGCYAGFALSVRTTMGSPPSWGIPPHMATSWEMYIMWRHILLIRINAYTQNSAVFLETTTASKSVLFIFISLFDIKILFDIDLTLPCS